MYQTARWSKMRAKYLSMQPLCQSCLKRGVVSPATDIDHVFPWRPLGKEAFHANYFQCLCHECHASKTQLEKRGICVDYRGEQTLEYKLDEYPRHRGFFFET